NAARAVRRGEAEQATAAGETVRIPSGMIKRADQHSLALVACFRQWFRSHVPEIIPSRHGVVTRGGAPGRGRENAAVADRSRQGRGAWHHDGRDLISESRLPAIPKQSEGMITIKLPLLFLAGLGLVAGISAQSVSGDAYL